MLTAAVQIGPLSNQLGELMSEMFGGDIPEHPLTLYQVAARAAVVYIIGLAIVRIGKGRLLGRVTALDVILGFILGSLLSRGITGNASISGTTIASAVLVGIHWLFTYIACRWHGFGNLIKGHALILVKDGKKIPENMLHSHISDHDLDEVLRLSGVESVDRVHLAHKERNGEVSVVRRNEPRVVEIGIQAGVQTVRIEVA